jgi:hypothetical protein
MTEYYVCQLIKKLLLLLLVLPSGGCPPNNTVDPGSIRFISLLGTTHSSSTYVRHRAG